MACLFIVSNQRIYDLESNCDEVLSKTQAKQTDCCKKCNRRDVETHQYRLVKLDLVLLNNSEIACRGRYKNFPIQEDYRFHTVRGYSPQRPARQFFATKLHRSDTPMLELVARVLN
jgi:hypothetical protein